MREKREIYSFKSFFFGDSSKFDSCTHALFKFLNSYFGDEQFLFSIRLQSKYTNLLKNRGNLELLRAGGRRHDSSEWE